MTESTDKKCNAMHIFHNLFNYSQYHKAYCKHPPLPDSLSVSTEIRF